MRRRFFIVLILGLFLFQTLSGCTWFSDEEDHGEEFKEEDLVAPQVPSYPPHSMPDKPPVNESQLPPGFKYKINWAMGDVYAFWGGFIRISIENTGSNDIFVYRSGIVVNWSTPSEWIYEERNVLIRVGEEKHLGLVYFNAPNTTGNYTYQVLISLLVMDNGLYSKHNIESWYDNGTVLGSEKIFFVHPLKGKDDIKLTNNYKYYQDKLNEKVDFEAVEVQNLVSNITAAYEGDYNIYQVLAIFDFIVNNLTYISDPAGRDYWAYCQDTLNKGGGDCEDFSILFSSMVGAIGGTTRVYLTKSHAFPALYIGNGTEINEILEAIDNYYGTESNYVIFKDEGNSWLAADPAGSLYMGGLPADAKPALIYENPLMYGFNFQDTLEIHAIDVVK
ncbi:MAG: transglutaminase domain-containing protein [Methanomassiliicoccales archaeon]|nr:MAG: transglutaminase domain-containing protein [Methanomassiliicoccales archaeon]